MKPGKRMKGKGVWPLENGRTKLKIGLAMLVAMATTWCSYAQAAKLAVASVSASANDGNLPANTLDGSLATRWSALGEGQWIHFDLGATVNLGTVKVAWYRGDQRSSLFDIQTSGTGSSWTTAYTGASSGSSAGLESYDVTDSACRYVRIVGHGNSISSWNSITEVELYGASSGGSTNTPPPPPPPSGNGSLAVRAVVASSDDGNVPANTLDRDLSTRWSANGDGQWIVYDLGSAQNVGSLKIAWHKGDQRASLLEIQTSLSGASWTTVFGGASSGSTTALESYDVADSVGQYVRILGHGNSQNLWNSISEVEIYGGSSGGITNAPPPPPPATLPPIKKEYAKLQIGSKQMAYYRNRPMDQYDPRVTRAIIVIHGAGANASGYFDRVNNIIPSSWGSKVMVIAPYFQDLASAPSGEYGWDGDWREGGASGGISSYAVLDKFIEVMRNGNFPNLKWVVVCGHSAGGQTTQRFACFTDADLKPSPNAAYVKFVVANPSSYVYLNEYRNPEGDNSWVVPAQECSSGDGYNEWKYGLEGLYGYTAARGADWARHYLPLRWVELLAGTADTFDNGDLDLDCGAMWQGPFRYQRAHIFDAFMDKYYPGNNLSITDVPGVDHDSTRMFASPQGINALFFAE